MAHRLLKRAVKAPYIQGNQYDASNHHAEIKPQLLVLQNTVKLTHQQQIITAEIHTEQQHKNRTDILYIWAVTRYAVIFNAKSTRSGGAKRRAHRVKQRHAAKKQECNIDYREHNIYQI